MRGGIAGNPVALRTEFSLAFRPEMSAYCTPFVPEALPLRADAVTFGIAILWHRDSLFVVGETDSVPGA
jgi:hypothetical protein